MSNKEKYKEFCDQQVLPIYMNYWWLNAIVGENNWNVALHYKGNEIFGVLPYVNKKKWMFKLINNPLLTQHLGPWLKYPPGQKYDSKLSFEKEAFQNLLAQLPFAHYQLIKTHYSINNWLPFYWKGYSCTPAYTYVIDNIRNNVDDLYENISSNTRKNIKKAQKLVKVYESNDINDIYSLNQKTFDRQSKKVPYSFSLLQELYSACKKSNCCKILVAKDENNKVHASLFLVWNNRSAYYLVGGGDPALRNSEAMTLLMWEAIQFSSTVADVFDFEGSMIESIERFVRGFGAKQKSYYKLNKYSNGLLRLLVPLFYGDQ